MLHILVSYYQVPIFVLHVHVFPCQGPLHVYTCTGTFVLFWKYYNAQVLRTERMYLYWKYYNTHIYIPFQCAHKLFSCHIANMNGSPITDKVVVFEGWQLLGFLLVTGLSVHGRTLGEHTGYRSYSTRTGNKDKPSKSKLNTIDLLYPTPVEYYESKWILVLHCSACYISVKIISL